MIADDLAAQISGLADAVDVTTSMADQVPQVKVTMNREAACSVRPYRGHRGRCRSLRAHRRHRHHRYHRQ